MFEKVRQEQVILDVRKSSLIPKECMVPMSFTAIVTTEDGTEASSFMS